MFRLVPEVHRVIRHCHQCQVKDQKAPKQKDVYRPSVHAGAPFQVWSMDILGPLHASSEGHRYLLTLKDVFSKWFEAIPLGNTTSNKVLRALQLLYARFGHPLQVHTDNATYFHSQLMREAFQRAGIKLTFTPTYNPQSNFLFVVVCTFSLPKGEKVTFSVLVRENYFLCQWENSRGLTF